MPDAAIETALAHWGPRLIQNGVDYNDLMATVARTETWADWLPEWNRTADVQADFAAEADAGGHRLTAGQAWRRASVNRHFGKFVWMVDLDLAAEATRVSVEETLSALSRLDPTAERLEVPIEGGTAYANLRKPTGVQVPPYVVLIPGLDSTKEEFFFFEQSFLDRGMATISLDGPGQGETGFVLPIRPDYEAAAGAILDAVSARGQGDVDLERVGAAGVSLGGYYAPRAAAFEKRITAVAGISGPYDFAANWDGLPSLTRETIQHHTGAGSAEEARERAAALSLDGVADRIDQPCLVITGRHDRLIPWADTKRIADEAPNGEWVLFDDGNHVCNNIPYKYRPLVGDWMAY